MKNYYIKQVDNVSLETYEDDGELFGDDGFQMEESYSKSQMEFILAGLTNKQKKVVEYIMAGYKRKEIAAELGTGLQAVHQIVPRIRKRMLMVQSVSGNIRKKFNDYL